VVLLGHCKEILQQVQRAKDAMQSLQGSARQKFTLGLVPHIAKFAILTLVRDMRVQFPRAAITVVEGASTPLLESMLMDRIDAAIMYETPRSDLIEKRTLLREELYFIGPGTPSGPAPFGNHAFQGRRPLPARHLEPHARDP
jgi:LysR family transcriptional regulator, nitrogen assimilation regulatory protein